MKICKNFDWSTGYSYFFIHISSYFLYILFVFTFNQALLSWLVGLADFHWCDVIRISVRQICGLVCGVVCWSPHNKGALGSLWWPQQFPGLYKENLFYWGNVPLKNSILHVGCEYMWVVFFFFFFTAYAQICSLFNSSMLGSILLHVPWVLLSSLLCCTVCIFTFIWQFWAKGNFSLILYLRF